MLDRFHRQFHKADDAKPIVAMPLEGKNLTFNVDGEPVSYLSSVSEVYEQDGTQRLRVTFETTLEALTSKDVNARISAAMRGFKLGHAYAVRFDPKQPKNGVVTLISLEFDDDNEPYFLAETLTSFFILENNQSRQVYEAKEKIHVSPQHCENLRPYA